MFCFPGKTNKKKEKNMINKIGVRKNLSILRCVYINETINNTSDLIVGTHVENTKYY